MDSLNKVCYEQIKDTFYKGLIKAMETINDEKRDFNLFFNGIIPLKNF